MTEPQLRRLLAQAAGVSAPPDPWPDIRRRGHRMRRVQLVVVTATAAVAAAGIGVSALVLSRPTTPVSPTARNSSAPDMRALAHGTWRSVPAPPAAAIQDAAMVWTGRELILWGGSGPTGYLPPGGLRAGYAYQPATGRWQTLPPAPVSGNGTPEAVWTGTDVVVAGPHADGQVQLAAYRPTTGTWRRLPTPPVAGFGSSDYQLIWTGRELLLYGYSPEALAKTRGPFQAGPQTVLAALTVDGARWRILATPPGPPQHTQDQGFTALWSGSQLLVFTQRMHVDQLANGYSLAAGGSTVTSYDPRANAWTTVPSTGPAPPLDGTTFWTGRVALLVGGVACTVCSEGPVEARHPLSGGVFDPVTGSWRALSPPTALNVMPQAVAWAGDLIAVAGASNFPGLPRQPAVASAWDPDTGQWIRLPVPPVSFAEGGSPITGAWTGQEFIFPDSTGLVTFTPAS